MHVRDTVTWRSDEPYNWWLDPGDTLGYHRHRRVEFPYDRPLYLSSFWVGWDTEEDYDTLWLRCHDYGAHCLVTPIISGKIDSATVRHMDPYETLWGEQVWTITVPYDYDGYTGCHFNYGDGMNDYWEMAQFAVNDSRPIRPFVAIHPVHGRGSADYDPEPVGRDIDGDSWCNFAEYRGVIVREDSTFLQRSDSQHVRLDPLRKTVLVHVRNNTLDTDNRMWRDLMPGFIYNLYPDTMEIYFTDSIRFTVRFRSVNASETENTDIRRMTPGIRSVNFNHPGAGLWYYGFGAPIQKPMKGDGNVNAVTLWSWYPGCEIDTGSQDWVGRNYHVLEWGPEGGSGGVPDGTSRIVINMRRYNEIRDFVPQYHNWFVWSEAFARDCRRTIAHEFGHSVGMLDIDLSCNSTVERPLMAGGCVFEISGFQFSDSLFSAESKAEFSVKEER